MTFHSRVKRAQEFARSLPDVIAWMPDGERPEGPLWSDYVSGEMAAGARHVLLQYLRQLDQDERGVLANVRCLAEGVDVPALDGVAFIDPKRAEVDIVQAVGRAIRRSPDKTIGTIVIPVFIDTDEDPEIALNDSTFDRVWDVVKALRAHDEWLGEQLDAIRRQLGRQAKRGPLPEKIRLDLPERISIDFARAFEARLVEQTTVSWEGWFGHLLRYVELHGHARVPKGYEQDDYRLGQWASDQRKLYTKGKLDPDRERRLEELPSWTWNPLTTQWEEGFSQVRRYVERHGHARVPQAMQDGYPLGVWASDQRKLYAKGKLDPDRQRRLEELPGWTWNTHTDKWEDGFGYLQHYVDRHGNARIPQRYEQDGYRLGHWAGTQRRSYAKGKLDPDRQRRLEELPGWTWNAASILSWEGWFGQLGRYVELHGHARVPTAYELDGHRLGKWAAYQRQSYAKGKLSADRARRFEELPGWTWGIASTLSWEGWFGQLARYVERHGHARVPMAYEQDGYPLGPWASRQRRSYAKGKLDPDRQRRLEVLPGWTWNTHTASWEEGFGHCEGYVARHGFANVPRYYEQDGYQLGNWVVNQRQIYAKGKLDPDRVRRLEELPGWTWNTHTDQWEEGYGHLQRYVERHGHARVPKGYEQDGYPLGPWVLYQRQLKAKGNLDPDRVRRLVELPGWTWNTITDRWEEGYGHLQRYVEIHGHTRVPKFCKQDGFRLGGWVSVQRQIYAKGKLDPDRVRRLEGLPDWRWNAITVQWEEGFGHLLRYVEFHGHTRVPRYYEQNGYRLGHWASRQRWLGAKGKLSADRARRLEELPGWTWGAREQ
jgi:hypothetical protein